MLLAKDKIVPNTWVPVQLTFTVRGSAITPLGGASSDTSQNSELPINIEFTLSYDQKPSPDDIVLKYSMSSSTRQLLYKGVPSGASLTIKDLTGRSILLSFLSGQQ